MISLCLLYCDVGGLIKFFFFFFLLEGCSLGLGIGPSWFMSHRLVNIIEFFYNFYCQMVISHFGSNKCTSACRLAVTHYARFILRDCLSNCDLKLSQCNWPVSAKDTTNVNNVTVVHMWRQSAESEWSVCSRSLSTSHRQPLLQQYCDIDLANDTEILNSRTWLTCTTYIGIRANCLNDRMYVSC